MPQIQGYPAGFSSNISISDVHIKINILDGREIDNEVDGEFSIGLYRPQKDYFINFVTIEEIDGHQLAKEIYIPITSASMASFVDTQTLTLSFFKNDSILTQLELTCSNRLNICKIFACFIEQNFFATEQPSWTQEIETLTFELRHNFLQKASQSSVINRNSSFTRVKVIFNKDATDLRCSNNILIKVENFKPKKLCLNFGEFEPNFTFAKALRNFENLQEIEVYGTGFKTYSVVAFLKEIKNYKNVKSLIFASTHQELKEKELSIQSIIRFCPSHITTLGLIFDEQIPHAIEYLKNLKHLFVSIHNLFSYRLFTLPNLMTINVARASSYKQNFFPSTALKFDIDKNLINTGYFAFDTVYYTEKTLTNKIPSLFEIAAGKWYNNTNLQKYHLPDVVDIRLFYGRVDFQMCTSCEKIFNDKLFSAWIIRKKDESQHQYFKHKFCFDCFEKDRTYHSNFDVVVTRNHC